jgi:hypothetical protein
VQANRTQEVAVPKQNSPAWTGLAIRILAGALAPIAAAMPMSAGAQTAPRFTSVTDEFDRFATETAAMAPDKRARLFLERFNKLVPDFYQPRFGATQAQYVGRIQKALERYPASRAAFLRTSREFSSAYVSANAKFLTFFPDYAPRMPIYLLHSIGEMDGGTRNVNGKTVAVFGADVIAQIHDSTTIRPFLDHELFHLYHDKYFSGCDDVVWCALWTEGLAVYVASKMEPAADDRALLLTLPRPIRPEVEPRLDQAMCMARAKLDSSDQADYATFFQGMDSDAPFPPRFGYLLGYLLVQKIAAGRTLDQLAKLPRAQVRPLLDAALAEYDCAAVGSPGPSAP